jgi:two-component system chemotaxis sensor kinase CheA
MSCRMSDYLDPKNEELLKDFFEEAHAQVELLEANVLVLESDPGNRDAVDEIFRAAHTLKGGAGTVEMNEISEFTHLIEDVLDQIRSGELRVTGKLVDDLLASIDTVKQMLDARAEGRVFSRDISPLTASLRVNIRGRTPSDSAVPSRGRPAKPRRPETGPSAAEGRKDEIRPAIQKAGMGQPEAAARTEKTKRVSSTLSEYELLELSQASEGQGTIYRVTVSFDENNPMNTVGGIQVFAALKEVGKVLRSIPDFESLCGDEFYPVVDYFIASKAGADKLRSACTITDVTLSADVMTVQTGTAELPQLLTRNAEGAEKAAVSPVHPGKIEEGVIAEEHLESAGGKSVKVSQGSVLRVDSHRIDDLLNLVSEAVIAKASFNQISLQYAQSLVELAGVNVRYRDRVKEFIESLPGYLDELKTGKAESVVMRDIAQRFGTISGIIDPLEKLLKSAVGRFRNSSQNLARIIGELQEAVMRIRMVPIAHVFSRFPRLVRDLSKNLGKSVDLAIEGEETELDKSVIEDLVDPLIHCVRNSIDHGIESAEERIDAGKPTIGHVRLRARNEGNMIVIEVNDDGRGMDVEAIRKKAIERGLIHPSKNLTTMEAYALIFEPGFSTAQQVTSISGRGVGLDVVKRSVDKLAGTVGIESQAGKGTTFTIRLPLTLAIIQGLLVRVGPEIYAIPVTSVIESLRLKPAEVKLIDGYEVFNLRDDVLSLLRLNRLFRINADESQTMYFVVVVGTQEKKVGLVVDSLIGEEDLVIKPLKGHYTASPGIAGATILGDGKVSLILDVGRLLEFSVQHEQDARKQRTAAGVE